MTSFRSLRVVTVLLMSLILAGTAQAAKVAGVELEDSFTVGDTEVFYQGAGVRKKLFIEMYVGSLYLANSSSDSEAIVLADEPMAIRLNILSDLLTRKKMIKAYNDGFKRATGGDTAAIQSRIDHMVSLMKEKLRPGNSYTLAYEPGVGTHISRNGEEATVIEGLDFKQALFGIWLSDKPAQADLKSAMLGE